MRGVRPRQHDFAWGTDKFFIGVEIDDRHLLGDHDNRKRGNGRLVFRQPFFEDDDLGNGARRPYSPVSTTSQVWPVCLPSASKSTEMISSVSTLVGEAPLGLLSARGSLTTTAQCGAS